MVADERVKARNPDIKLMALVYGVPAWLGAPFQSAANNARLARYASSWVSGARNSHNLTIDNVGIWNERPYTKEYVFELCRQLDAAGLQSVTITANDFMWEPIASDFANDAKLRSCVDSISAHYMYPTQRHNPSDATAQSTMDRYRVPLWSSEDYSVFSDNAGAATWAHILNSNYVTQRVTLTSAWHMVAAFYPSVPLFNRGMILAHTPWSGDFLVQPNVWITAHTTHFADPNTMWYLANQSGSGSLAHGGKFVSFANP